MKPKRKPAGSFVFAFGPFLDNRGFIDAARLAPVEVQPDSALRSIARHTFNARVAADANDELTRRGLEAVIR